MTFENFFKRINSHFSLLLAGAFATDDGEIRLIVKEIKPLDELRDLEIAEGVVIEKLRPVEFTEDCSSYEIRFDTYVALNVANESYCIADPSEPTRGKLLKTYDRSQFLDYVRESTSARDDYPGPMTHYRVVTEDHIIDVVSCDPPEIEVLHGKGATEES